MLQLEKKIPLQVFYWGKHTSFSDTYFWKNILQWDFMEDPGDSISINGYNRGFHYAFACSSPCSWIQGTLQNLEHGSLCGALNRKSRMEEKGNIRMRKELKAGEKNSSSNLMLEINFSLLFQLCLINSLVNYNRDTILLIYMLTEQCQVYLDDNRMLTPRKRPDTDKWKPTL